MDDRRNGFRQRHLDLMETRLGGPEVDDDQTEIHERHLGVGVALGSSLGLAMGAGLGAALGNLAWGTGIGLSIGTGVGIALGAAWGNKHAEAATHPERDGGA